MSIGPHSRFFVRAASIIGLLLCFAPQVNTQTTSNRNPVFTPGGDTTVLEDSSWFDEPWATDLGDGEVYPGAPNNQSLTFLVSNDNTVLFRDQPRINSNTGKLKFRPNGNRHGEATVTVTLRDDGTSLCVLDADNLIFSCPDGCVPADCRKSSPITFKITILPKNDCPFFSSRGWKTTNEDAGEVTHTGYLYSISQGSSLETDQSLTFAISNDNNGLFEVQPYLVYKVSPTYSASTCDLIYKSAPNAHGYATVSIVATDDGGTPNGGCDKSTTRTMRITVKSINDAPSFTASGPTTITILEDHGPYQYSNWAKSMNPGANNEGTQTLTFVTSFVDSSHSSLFSSSPKVDPLTGSLSFTAKPDVNTASATVKLYIQLKDSAGGTSCSPITACTQLQIIITAVNDAPTFSAGSDIELWEDMLNMATPPSPLVYSSSTKWATSISTGSTLEADEGETVNFVVTTDATDLFAVNPTIDSTGSLHFVLEQDKNGVARCVATIWDSNGLSGTTHSFLIQILSSNDAPEFAFRNGGDGAIVVQEDSEAFSDANFLNSIRKGPADESTQQLFLTLTTSQTALFSVQPTLAFTTSDTAKLDFTPAEHAYGSATVTAQVKDNGGVARKGVDSYSRQFTITITSVNDAPRFKLAATTVSVVEDQYSVSGFSQSDFLSDLYVGHGAELTSQTLSIACSTTVTSLFSALPRIDTGGKLTFTTGLHRFGSSEVSFTVTDSGSPPLTVTGTFTISINAKNDAPTFTAGSDISLDECESVSPCPFTAPNWATSISTGASGEEGQTLVFSLSSTTDVSSLLDQLPVISPSTGTLSLALKPGAHTAALGGKVTFTVTLSDSGGTLDGGVDSSSQTFTLEVKPTLLAPGFDVQLATLSCNEDAPEVIIDSFLTSISTGVYGELPPSNLEFYVTTPAPLMFSSAPSLVVAGSIAQFRFKPQAETSGTTIIKIEVLHNVSTLSKAVTLPLAIHSVNDKPTFSMSQPAVAVHQGAGSYSLDSFLSNLNPGVNEASQSFTLSVHCQASSSLFIVSPNIDTSGTLTFTTTTSGTGTVSCTVIMQDDGGTEKGGTDTSSPQTFMISIGVSNVAPVFTVGPSITVAEDIGSYTSGANWITNVGPGAGDPVSQVLSPTVTCTSGAGLFYSGPQLDISSKTLSFQTLADANGVADCSIYLEDDGPGVFPDVNRSGSQSFKITVMAVNDAPTFTLQSTTLSVLEDSGPKSYLGFASDILPGPIDESSQTVSWTVSLLSPANAASLFKTAPSIDSAGTLSFTPQDHAFGAVSVSACLTDSGTAATATTCKTFTLAILSVNDAPSISPNVTISYPEDSGSVSISNVFPLFSAGPPNEATQMAKVSSTFATPQTCSTMFRQAPILTLSGGLEFETLTDANGDCSLNVIVEDDEGSSASSTILIKIFPVNDPPRVAVGPSIELLQGAGPVTVGNWLTSFSPGPSDEQATQQIISALITTADDSLFVSTPVVSLSTGTLTFEVKPTTIGSIPLTVVLKDDGGTDHAGVDQRTYHHQTSIQVTPTNTAPSFELDQKLLPVTTFEDVESPVIIPGFVKKMAMGSHQEEETSQTISFSLATANSSIRFVVDPRIDENGTLTFQPGKDEFGNIQVSVTMQDSGGTRNGGVDASPTTSFPIKIIPVNDKPVFNQASMTVTVIEDQVLSFVDFLTQVDPGPSNEVGIQKVKFSTYSPQLSAKALSRHLKSIQLESTSSSASSSANLVIDPAPDFNGRVSLILRGEDDGGKENGGEYVTSSSIVVEVVPVNDPPRFKLSTSRIEVDMLQSNWSHNEVFGFVSKISPGPANEANQTVTLSLEADQPSLFVTQPALDLQEGVLRFTIDTTKVQLGTSTTLKIIAVDDGGILLGGNDTTVQTVEIKLTEKSLKISPKMSSVTLTTSSDVALPWVAASETITYSVEVLPSDDSSSSRLSTRLLTSTPRVDRAGKIILKTGLEVGKLTLRISATDLVSKKYTSVPLELAVEVIAPIVLEVVLPLTAAEYSARSFLEKIAKIFGDIDQDRIEILSTKVGSVSVHFYIKGDMESLDVSPEVFVRKANQPSDVIHSILPMTSARVVSGGSGGGLNSSSAPSSPGTNNAAQDSAGRNTNSTAKESFLDGFSLTDMSLEWTLILCGVGVMLIILIVTFCICCRRGKRGGDVESGAKKKRKAVCSYTDKNSHGYGGTESSSGLGSLEADHNNNDRNLSGLTRKAIMDLEEGRGDYHHQPKDAATIVSSQSRSMTPSKSTTRRTRDLLDGKMTPPSLRPLSPSGTATVGYASTPPSQRGVDFSPASVALSAHSSAISNDPFDDIRSGGGGGAISPPPAAQVRQKPNKESHLGTEDSPQQLQNYLSRQNPIEEDVRISGGRNRSPRRQRSSNTRKRKVQPPTYQSHDPGTYFHYEPEPFHQRNTAMGYNHRVGEEDDDDLGLYSPANHKALEDENEDFTSATIPVRTSGRRSPSRKKKTKKGRFELTEIAREDVVEDHYAPNW